MKKLLLSLAAVFLAVSAQAGSYPDISREDLKKAIAANEVVIIDVNGTASYNGGHIPGAIDFMVVGEDLAAKLPADKAALIVAYCSSPKCGAYARAADAASKLGYTNVKHYSDGIKGWKAAGEPTEKAE